MSTHSRSRSRSPLEKSNTDQSKFVNPESVYLFIGNLPHGWPFAKIKNFLKRSTNPEVAHSIKFVTVLKNEAGEPKGESLVEFISAQACSVAMKALRGLEVEGKTLVVMPDSGRMLSEELIGASKSNEQKNTGPPNKPHKQNKQNSGPPPQMGDMHKNYETYGLSRSFLESHGIKLPLRNKVFVGNLGPKVEESGLREVFSYAGHVLLVLVIRKKDKVIAKVEYDHPVEAVQAVSMFNNQEYEGRKMIVQMDTSARSYKNVPPGLSNIGPGLGPNGEPMRGIRNAIELEPVKQLLIQELVKLQNWRSQESNGNMNSMNQGPTMDSMGLMNNPGMVNQNAFFNPMGDLTNMFNANQFSFGQNNLFNSQMNSMQMIQEFFQKTGSLASLAAFNQTGANFTQNQVMNPLNQMSTMQTTMNNMPMNSLNNMPANQMAVPMSQVSTMPQNQLANMSQSQLMDLAKNQFSQGANSTPQASNLGGDWSTQQENTPQPKAVTNRPVESKSSDRYGSSSHREIDDGPDRRSSKRSSEKNAMTSDMLVFNNLPPSVTVKALTNKMREVGDVKFAEITGQGRAIVRFADLRDAERCIKLFDRSKVDGTTITVRFF